MPKRVPAAAMNANWVPRVTTPSAIAPVSPPPNDREIRMLAAKLPITKTARPTMFCAVPAASVLKSLPSLPANTPCGSAAASSIASSSGSTGGKYRRRLRGHPKALEQGAAADHRIRLADGESRQPLLVRAAVGRPPSLERRPHA